MTIPLADYQDQRQAFEALFDAGCPHRILFFKGASGSGKTTILRYCLERVPDGVMPLRYDLKGETPVAEVFHRAGQQLTWQRLPQLTKQVSEMQATPVVRIDSNFLAGINNHISVALHAEQPVDREHRRSLLTNALFDDLQALGQTIMIVFDTFERALTEVQSWIGGPVLARAVHFDRVRVVVAGQMVPDRHNIEWGHCCEHHELYGIQEAQHWLPVIEALKRAVPNESPLNWLAGVCHALKGNPEAIFKVIEGLPQRRMVS